MDRFHVAISGVPRLEFLSKGKKQGKNVAGNQK